MSKVISISRDEVARLISSATGYREELVSTILEAAADVIYSELSRAKDGYDIVIRPFMGLLLESKKNKKRCGFNPKTQEQIEIPEKIRATARFTRTFAEKINKKEEQD